MFSATKAAVWFTLSLFTVLQLKAHSYVSAERMGASSGFDFFPYHNSNANFIATTAQYKAHTSSLQIFSNL